jgi:hypothetical protein
MGNTKKLIFTKCCRKVESAWRRLGQAPHQLAGLIGGRQGFGLNEVIGIAAGIIIAVVVVIPGLRGFAGDILDNLADWWNDMAASVFTAS